VRGVFDRLWAPRSRYTNGPHVRRAFRAVVADVREATVEVRSRGKRVAYGGIVGPDGWVVTKASQLRGPVTCRLKDGRELDPRLVGVDSDVDLAMVKIAAKGLPVLDLSTPAPIESSEFVAIRTEDALENPTDAGTPDEAAHSSLMPGDWLATVGLGRDPTAVGVVSVLPRPIDKRPGFLGIAMDLNYQPPEGATPAVKVTQVTPDSAASEAGLEAGDLIVAVGSDATPDAETLRGLIGDRNPGDRIELEVLRGEERLELLAILRGWAPNPAQRRAYYQNNLGGELSERRFGFPSALQHDTVLEADDCGGPVVDLEGRVVGFNIARSGRTESYALPAEAVESRLLALMSGRLAPAGEDE